MYTAMWQKKKRKKTKQILAVQIEVGLSFFSQMVQEQRKKSTLSVSVCNQTQRILKQSK